MKLEDLKGKQIGELSDLIVDKAQINLRKTTSITEALPVALEAPCMIVATDDANKVQGVVTGHAIAVAARDPGRFAGTIEPHISREYLEVDLADSIGKLTSRLASMPVEVAIVTDKHEYVGIIDRQKLADKVEELLV